MIHLSFVVGVFTWTSILRLLLVTYRLDSLSPQSWNQLAKMDGNELKVDFSRLEKKKERVKIIEIETLFFELYFRAVVLADVVYSDYWITTIC